MKDRVTQHPKNLLLSIHTIKRKAKNFPDIVSFKDIITKFKILPQKVLAKFDDTKRKTFGLSMKVSLEDEIRKSNIILPEHKRELHAFLNNLSSDIYKKLYDHNIKDVVNLYQGDVLDGVQICFVDENGDIFGERYPIALISHACDMQPNRTDFIIVSPIVILEEYIEELRTRSPGSVENIVKEIRENKRFKWFYLPQKNDFPESFIDFSTMVSVSSVYLNEIKKTATRQCLLSLSRTGWYLFLIKLSYHFARQEELS